MGIMCIPSLPGLPLLDDGTVPLLWTEGAGIGAAVAALVVAHLGGHPVTRCAARLALRPLAAGVALTAGDLHGPIIAWGCHVSGKGGSAEWDARASLGPFTRAIIGGPEIYGHPAWLVPWLHNTDSTPSHDLGLVLRPGEAVPRGLPDWVAVMAGNAPDDEAGVIGWLDRFRACRRILATTVDGLAIAEAYGIPCLALVTDASAGMHRVSATPDFLPHEMADFYAGLRRKTVPVFAPPGDRLLDPDAVISAIDRAWSPAWLREDDLIAALPRDTGHAGGAPAVHTAKAVPVTLDDVADAAGGVPLCWAATSEAAPYPNLGDALSAVLVSAISGRPLVRRNFDDRGERLAAVGTIGHTLRNGIVHFWGTGLDAKRNAFDPGLGRFAAPPDTRFHAHAMRGRNSARQLRAAGIEAPDVFGDPVCFIDRIAGHRPVTPRWELGVIVHITELERLAPESPVVAAYRRYDIPPGLSGAIRIINTYTEQGIEGLLARIDDIRACRRIVSTSFHGLVIPETFGIPNAWFSTHPGAGFMADVENLDLPMDHRVRDWYSGTTRRHVPVFGAQRHLPTRWDQVIRWLDRAWEPLRIDSRGLFDAFPLRPAVSFDAPHWPLHPALFDGAAY